MDATASRPPDLRYSKLHFIPEFATRHFNHIKTKFCYSDVLEDFPVINFH
jgi:hypothetical protein